MGYVFANGISLFAYYKAKKIKSIMVPKFYMYFGFIFGIINIPFYFAGLIVINYLDYGLIPAIAGVVLLLLYIPIWFYSKHENTRIQLKEVLVSKKFEEFI